MTSFKRSLAPDIVGIVITLLLLQAFTTSSPQLLLFISLLSTLLFFGIGSLVWLFARDRKTAQLLGGFCFALAFTFSAESQAAANGPFASAWTTASSAAALLLLSLVLLFFPHNMRNSLWKTLLIWILCFVGSLAIIYAIPSCLPFLWPLPSLPEWTNSLYYLYCFLLISADFLYLFYLFILSFHLSDKRTRQQIRLITLGGVAFVPFLLGTLLPNLINATLVIPGVITTSLFWIFPLALAYALLRYEMIVLDRTVRRACRWITYGISASICICLLYQITTYSISNVSLRWGIWIMGSCLCAVALWQGSTRLIDALFFQEYRAALQHIETPETLEGDLLTVTDTLLSAAEQFLTASCCLFLLDEQLDRYIPLLRLSTEGKTLLEHLQQIFQLEDGETFSPDHGPIQHIVSFRIRRPLLWRDLAMSKEKQTLTTSHRPEDRVILAPLWNRRKLIAVLVCARISPEDYGYAGPDLELCQMLAQRFTNRLETARITWQAGKYDQLLEDLMLLPDTNAPLEEVATNITATVAKATAAHAEIRWLDSDQQMTHIADAGRGPDLPPFAKTSLDQAQGKAFFWAGNPHLESLSALKPYDDALPPFPLAWLPFEGNPGVLLLTYSQPHVFLPEEQRILELFASRCAALLEQAQKLSELRRAYERQKELDQLKDQFLVMASHELRTPLTAIQGYIELLHDYNTTLTPDMHTTFLAKARNGCDELSLLVGNILDASHIQNDAERAQLRALPLRTSIAHTIEMFEAINRLEQRKMELTADPGLVVLADEMHLHQVLRNILSNALKYSPGSTPIEIGATADTSRVTIHIRDYGRGVPKEGQRHLFERFYRLERDMNSPVRGSGLGLFICRRLIEAMGGKIWVESEGEQGHGSTFFFTLQRITT